MNEAPYAGDASASVWQQHTYAEFVLKDAEAALATMTDEPYVLLIGAGTGGWGRAAVRRFYTERFLPRIPPDFELLPLYRTVADSRIVEEMVLRFTHMLAMEWLLPGVPATGRRVEVAAVAVIEFEAGRIAAERLYWDQATVLAQLGLADHAAAAAGLASAAKLLNFRERQTRDDEWG